MAKPRAPTLARVERIEGEAQRYFFVMALARCQAWADAARLGTTRLVSDALKIYLRAVEEKNAKEYRDVLEHEVEYMFGRGKKPGAYLAQGTLPLSIGGLTFQADPSSTLILGDRVLLGGRLDVAVVVAAARQALDALSKVEQDRATQLAAHASELEVWMGALPARGRIPSESARQDIDARAAKIREALARHEQPSDKFDSIIEAIRKHL
jgi:hypothetical protein